MSSNPPTYDDDKILPAAAVSATVEEGAEYAKDDVRVDVHTNLYDGVQRKMEQRHMQMIALAGTLGTGLFLGSGKTIAHGGPVGSFLAFVLTGSIVYSMLVCVGEMAVYAPISGGYIHYIERWLNPSVGFAVGWQVCFQYCLFLPSEIIAASILISYWDTSNNAHQAAYMIALMVGAAAINFFGVRWFGESEFIFAFIKIALVIGLIIAGLVVDLGGGPTHDRIGFRYWKDPGAFAEYHFTGDLGKFLGFFTNLLQAAGSFAGIESIAVAAAEVKNPRVALTKAIKRLFWRITIFYILLIFVVGLLVPYTDPSLLQSTGTAASSPFVIAFQRAGIKALPSIINAAVLTSAFSAGSSLMYSVSRMLYGLSLRGYAPRILARTTKKGLPIVSLCFVTLFYALSFMTLSKGASTVLNWLSNLNALIGYITWGTIAITYLRFKKGLEAQGIDRKTLHYHSRLQPWPAYWVILWSGIIIIFNGWEVFTAGHWSGSDFVIAYITIPVFFILILGYWLVKRPKHLTIDELDMYSNIPSDEEVSYEEPPPKNWGVKVVNFLFT
uniref:Amino acid permease/ SLC12A domain-containing protein n=1 Tax=Kwoniella dejecticola CBS 10117 TaxID=1296121 RepID=A0A1A6AB23_9TREE|nr:uncharacterized protein I303_03275 [Kwoniella dejecticola CBS 10117]OBR87250.1 hypothetical protein I303_03275 [Kwoniella dejecticola CBS 10117]